MSNEPNIKKETPAGNKPANGKAAKGKRPDNGKRRVFWSHYVGLIVMALTVGMNFLLWFVLDTKDVLLSNTLGVLALDIFAIGLPLVFLIDSFGGREAFLMRRISFIEGLWSVLTGLGMFFLMTSLQTLLTILWQSVGLPMLGGSSVTVNETWRLLAMIVVVGIVPAFFESTFLQGVLLPVRLPLGRKLALVSVSLLSALMSGSLLSIPIGFVTGLILCRMTLASHSTYPSMIAHMTNNILVVLLSYGLESSSSASAAPIVFGDIWMPVLIYLAMGALFLVVSYAALRRAAQRRFEEVPEMRLPEQLTRTKPDKRVASAIGRVMRLPAILTWVLLIAYNVVVFLLTLA